ncbi:MAG: BamA/TamA family outer membrane protein [Alphaproteobacteria bacterium]|nr:BamA/TamA family outer membrane protein [Alphaproteobacteria bacterium]
MKLTGKSRKILAVTALCGSLLSFAPPAQAQQQLPEAAVSTADPGRVQDQMRDSEFVPSVSPRVEVRDIVMQKAPEGAENIKFVLKDVMIEGASVYSPETLEAMYASQLGSTVSLADMYVLANDMTNRYRNNGYILTQVIIPPQTIDGGRIKFQVVEGYVNAVTVIGDETYGALGQIRDYAEKIKTDQALNVDDLERYLLLINDLPGVEARSVLSPSPTQVGAAELQIFVERDLYEAYLGIDNFGSRYLGPVQGTAVGSLNSYFRNNEKITLQAVYAPSPEAHPELAFGSLIYSQPITDEGTTLELIGSYTATNPGYTLEQFDVEGRSKFASVKVEHPLIRSRSANLYAHLGFDWRNVTTTNNIEADRKDDIRALRLGGRAEAMDTFFGSAAINSLSLEMGQGLEILGSSDDNTPNLSRAQGRADFTKFEGEIQRLQKLTNDVNLLLGARGQYSADALLSSEEFGVGGINYGRGFDSSEIVGDQGFAGKVEVQWKEPVNLDLFQTYQLYGFFDAGRTFNEDATTSSQKTDTVTSTGFGMRADFMENTKMGLAVALPLNRDVETQGDQGPRVYFNLSRAF